MVVVVVVDVVVALVGWRCAAMAANVEGSVGGILGRQLAASRRPTLHCRLCKRTECRAS